MARRFFYSGDVSIEDGGYFYCLDTWQWGYVDVVRVTPCADAGGPDNLFWVEELTVNLREGAKLDSALACCGLTVDTLPTGAARRHALVDCHVAYGAYDVLSSTTVRVGPVCPITGHRAERGDCFDVDTVLRGNASLRKYARRIC